MSCSTRFVSVNGYLRDGSVLGDGEDGLDSVFDKHPPEQTRPGHPPEPAIQGKWGRHADRNADWDRQVGMPTDSHADMLTGRHSDWQTG